MLAKLWPKATGATIRASKSVEELAREFFEAARLVKQGEAAKELAAQRIKEVLGEHEGVTGDGWRATLKEREPAEIKAYVRAGYRHFDMREVKGK